MREVFILAPTDLVAQHELPAERLFRPLVVRGVL